MRERRGAVAGCLLIAAVLLGACVEIDDTSSGQQIYEQACANCHGDDLGGGIGPAVGAGSEVAARDDEYYVVTITRGRGRMPAFGSTLSGEQIDRVIEYLREQQGQ